MSLLQQDAASLTKQLKALAEGLGFNACGIARAEALDAPPSQRPSPAHEAYARYRAWVEAGLHAQMSYLAESPHLRAHPEYILPGARSLLIVLQRYLHTRRPISSIAQYAWSEDYHVHLRRRLQILADYLQRYGAEARPFVDTAPLLEKAWAVQAGLGWIGKNTLLLHRKLGSFTFIGGVLTTAELVPDAPFWEDFCGSCTRCIEACPTKALTPYVLDARKCIAYWTIEAPALDPTAPDLHGWIFGCDICQSVCPWNRFAQPQGSLPPLTYAFLSADAWSQLSRSQIRRYQRGSALRRARPEKLQQAAAIVAASHAKTPAKAAPETSPDCAELPAPPKLTHAPGTLAEKAHTAPGLAPYRTAYSRTETPHKKAP